MISLCSSFVIVCKGFETTERGGLPCLGNMPHEQMMARQTHLLPLEVSRSIAFLRIWVPPPPARRNAQNHARTHRNPPSPLQ